MQAERSTCPIFEGEMMRVSALLAVVALSASAPASLTSPDTIGYSQVGVDEATQVIYSSEPTPIPLLGVNMDEGVDGATGGDVQVANFEMSASPVIPANGETIKVIYADAETTYIGVTASCTHSITATRPTKSGGHATSTSTVTTSSGCSSAVSVAGQIAVKALFGIWSVRNQLTGTVYPGGGWSAVVAAKCNGNGQDQWKGRTVVGQSTASADSAAATLPCGR
ncbi:hypothetical protein [Pseudactinotalea sp. HY158]|uniref:hypothetical protein n=1 Tax=Pseudactinotalea sp. HY158 TaxID=2654547 RepID=UPI00129C68A6|nr:hypothetical protein [Pseudactinotalea sp. HY158]QGH70382.1 hypothetical protein GCE65_13435 [Pseudactinotalea sp. HY158]